MTRNVVIKILVLVITISAYFNVSQLINNDKLDQKNQTLESTIDNLVENQESMQNQIDTLTDQLNTPGDDSGDLVGDDCNKLFDIVLVVISEDDNLNETVNHCTNEPYLGDALDEVSDELELFFDPRYSKEYVYGRMAISFYGVTAQPGEYFQITVEGVYSPVGLDYTELSDNTSYEFTLVGW